MPRYLCRIASALLLIAVTNSVLAKDVWVFSSGKPSLLAQIPDDWKVGKEHEGQLNVFDGSPVKIAISFHLLRDARSPEDFITQEMRSAGGTVPTQKKPVQLAGQNGWLFETAGKNPAGVQLETDHYVARIDATYLIAIAVIFPPDTPQSDRAIIQDILASMKLEGVPSKG
jgi:hypothetical protein